MLGRSVPPASARLARPGRGLRPGPGRPLSGRALALAELPPGLTLLQGAVVERATARQNRLQRLLLLRRGFQLELEGLACALVFHTTLFCLIGENPATSGTFVALAGHPAFIPIAQARD